MNAEEVTTSRNFHLTTAAELLESAEHRSFPLGSAEAIAAAGVHAHLAAVYQQQLSQEAP